MKPMNAGTILALTLGAPSLLAAQNIPRDFASDVKHGVIDALAVYASPFRGSLRGYAIGVSSLAATGLLALEDENVAGARGLHGWFVCP